MAQSGKNLVIDRVNRYIRTDVGPAAGMFEVMRRDPMTDERSRMFDGGGRVYVASRQAGFRYGDAHGFKCVEFAVVPVDQEIAA